MNRTTIAMAALLFALAGGVAHAEGSDSGSGSDGGGGGDSGDNSMSILTGDSYAAFEAARTGKPHVDVYIAEEGKPVMHDELSERYARTNPFREDTA
jgi:hypothetical protein